MNDLLVSKKQEAPITGKIELKYYLSIPDGFVTTKRKPQDFKTIELICRDYQSALTLMSEREAGLNPNPKKYDLMFAYNEVRERGLLYLGHFNTGER